MEGSEGAGFFGCVKQGYDKQSKSICSLQAADHSCE